MAIIPNLPDLTAGNRARDAEGILKDVEMLIQAITPDWTDLSDSDPGIILMQLVSYLLDHAHWQVDRNTTDALLTRTSRRSIAVHAARALGYVVDGPTAATVTLTFNLTNGHPGGAGDTVTVPKATQCLGTQNGNTFYFETDSDLAIAHPATSGSVTATEGKASSEVLGTSNNEPHQKYVLTSTTILKNVNQNSLSITVGADTWTEVSSFAQSTNANNHYVVLRDHEDRLTVIFGDGIRGKVPANNSVITALYREGGGPLGNVASGVITTLNSTISFNGVAQVATVTNSDNASGAAARPTLERIKQYAPAFFASQVRAVTALDYNTLASTVSGVRRARAYRTYVNNVEVRVIPNGWDSTHLTDALKGNITTYLETRSLVTDNFWVIAAIPVKVRAKAVITVKSGYLEDDVRRKVEAELVSLYDPAGLDFGDSDTNSTSLFLSDFIATIDNTEGVNYVDVSEFTRKPGLIGKKRKGDAQDLYLNDGWDITSGDAVLGDVTVSDTTLNETWTITWTSALAYQVAGSISGTQVNTGTIGVAYTSDNGEVSFTVTVPNHAMTAGDRGRFVTSPLMDNIPTSDHEHPIIFLSDIELTVRAMQ